MVGVRVVERREEWVVAVAAVVHRKWYAFENGRRKVEHVGSIRGVLYGS